jgi:hypothetical protein
MKKWHVYPNFYSLTVPHWPDKIQISILMQWSSQCLEHGRRGTVNFVRTNRNIPIYNRKKRPNNEKKNKIYKSMRSYNFTDGRED